LTFKNISLEMCCSHNCFLALALQMDNELSTG
jgi:hypothetical protein